jgi:ABC-type branched-subunit amino acid transport system substrate-binding protein
MVDITARRLAALVLACLLMETACGARLSQSERAGFLGEHQSGSEKSGVGAAEISAGGPFDATGTTSDSAGDRSATVPLFGSSLDNGGATDLGVARDEIRIATVADVSGLVPGLAKAAHQGMAALAAYVNDRGGVYGRALRPSMIDSRTDATQTRAAVQQACDTAFAMVGSMSAFDEAGAEPGAACGIPDVSGITVSVTRASAPNVFAALPARPDYVPIGHANYLRERYPSEAQHAAMLWLNVSATRNLAAGWIKAYKSVGFRFVYEQEVQVLEANYSPYVYAMRDAGVQWVTFWADDSSMARMLKAMDQAEWRPRIVVLPPSGYTPSLLDQAGPAANGALVVSNTAPLEEIASTPEMQLYVRWLRRAAPGARPDFYGLMAWSAGRLFVQAAVAAGPRLTRAKLFDQLRKIRSWDGYGLHAPHDVGNKRMSGCFIILGVKSERFVRVAPSRRLACNWGGLVGV